jgi:CDP-paratose 2-epimerase
MGHFSKEIMRMETILVTGGAGFIGSYVALALKGAYPRARVVALDNLVRRGSELNVPRLAAGGVEFVKGDVRSPDDLDGVTGGDLMVECSAEPSVMAGYGDSPEYVIQTNLVGALHCFEWARKCGAGIVFLSTSRVYPLAALNGIMLEEEGARFALAKDQHLDGVSSLGVAEDFPIAGPRSLYGGTKLASEIIMAEYLAMYDIIGVINRCGVVAGPWQMGKIDQGIVGFWLARHIYGESLQYIGFGGEGKQVRDILHVEDLCRLLLHQIENLGALTGETFNVGGGAAVSASLCELTAICEEETGANIDIASVPETRPADVPLYITDNTKVTERTGWTPERMLRDVVGDTASWIAAHKEELRPILSSQ